MVSNGMRGLRRSNTRRPKPVGLFRCYRDRVVVNSGTSMRAGSIPANDKGIGTRTGFDSPAVTSIQTVPVSASRLDACVWRRYARRLRGRSFQNWNEHVYRGETPSPISRKLISSPRSAGPSSEPSPRYVGRSPLLHEKGPGTCTELSVDRSPKYRRRGLVSLLPGVVVGPTLHRQIALPARD
jgi:hypothetical protein